MEVRGHDGRDSPQETVSFLVRQIDHSLHRQISD